MEAERPRILELDRAPLCDAILVHGFWLSKQNQQTTLSSRSMFAVRAAYHEYKDGQGAKKIVITCGRLWGDEHPSVGSLMANSLISNFRVPEEDVVLIDQAYSTEEEIELFLEWANANGATKLLDIAPEKHHETIPMLYEKYEADVTYKSVEQSIYEHDDKKIVDYVRWFSERSRFAKGYGLYTLMLKASMHARLDYRFLSKIAQKQRRKPSHAGLAPLFGVIFPPIDRYYLEDENYLLEAV